MSSFNPTPPTRKMIEAAERYEKLHGPAKFMSRADFNARAAAFADKILPPRKKP